MYSSTLSLTSALDGVGGQRHAPAALPPGKTRYPLYRKLGGPQKPVWTCAENLAPTGVRSPDRPARSQSLYRLKYPGSAGSLRSSFFRDAVRPLVGGLLPNFRSKIQAVQKECWWTSLNPLHAELNPICHLLALLGARHILRVSRIRVNGNFYVKSSIMLGSL
jgi:hypothetical protein